MGFKAITASVGTTDTLLTTMPAFFTGAVVLALSNVNTSTAQTLTLKLQRNGSLAKETIGGLEIAAKAAVKYPAPIGLESGDSLWAVATSANDIKVTGSLVDGSQPTSSFALEELYSAKFVYDQQTATPDAAVSNSVPSLVMSGLFDSIRGCVVNSSGIRSYYLNPTNWAQKIDGSASVLTGADGDVMVEIPAFYYRTQWMGQTLIREISPVQLPGFTLHPAFIKDGVKVPYRYCGAYDACTYDVSASEYVSGLNWDNNSDPDGVAVDVTASTGDQLRSVKGIYPMVGLTRNEFRILAANRGTAFRQLDFTLWSAIQMLFMVEYQTLFSQRELGNGNVAGSYPGSSGVQEDSPHVIAGISDGTANSSTNSTSGADYMRYRGIENIYGNCWNWSDGINVNVSGTGNVHVTNNRSDFADGVTTNLELLTSELTTESNYIKEFLPLDWASLAKTTGGGSTTYVTDRHYGSGAAARVVRVGGNASTGANAGLFCVGAISSSANTNRTFGARLCC